MRLIFLGFLLLGLIIMPLGVLIDIEFPWCVMDPRFGIKIGVDVVHMTDIVNVVRLLMGFWLILQLSKRVSTFIHFHVIYRYQIIVHVPSRSLLSLENLLSFKSSCVLELNVHSWHMSSLFDYCSHALWWLSHVLWWLFLLQSSIEENILLRFVEFIDLCLTGVRWLIFIGKK